MKLLLTLALFYAAPALADLPKDLPPETDAKTDTRNDSCARLAVAAKSGRAIPADDSALTACAAGSRTVCLRTKELLDETPSTKDLLPACNGPAEVAASAGSRIVAGCKLLAFALSCMTNGLPTTPTMEDIPTIGIMRPVASPRSGISSH